jgi:hypothetical protein
MTYVKTLLFLILVCFTYDVQGQDCKCLQMNIVKNDSSALTHEGQIKVRIKNNCNVRRWFYTPGFWIRLIAEEGSARTSVIHKLHADLPEFILFKWKEEKTLTFHTDVNHSGEKIKITYENTDHIYPSRLFGSKTYVCTMELDDK